MDCTGPFSHCSKLTAAAEEFNNLPDLDEWVSAAENLGVFGTSPASPPSIASFLRTAAKCLDSTRVGMFLSEDDPFHSEVLRCYLGAMEFSGLSFAKALGSFLGAVRLPGDAQRLDRLLEAFSSRLYEQHERQRTARDASASASDARSLSRFDNADQVFLLTFSSSRNLSSVTPEDFVRQWRSALQQNDGAFLPDEQLRELYFAMRCNWGRGKVVPGEVPISLARTG